VNTVFPEPPPEDDRCADCGASFELHEFLGTIKYPKRNPDPKDKWITDNPLLDDIPVSFLDYGVCTGYKMSL
jgi:hypothetical protein